MQKLIIILLSGATAAMLAAALYMTFTDYPAKEMQKYHQCPISKVC